MMRSLVLIGLVVAAGCTDFPDIGAGQCGNGVIDDNEDCDSQDGCVACQRICTRLSEITGCETLGAGYRCGADDRCHAPSGVFEQVQHAAFPFVVGQGFAADIDSDGIGDVIGFGDVNIDVRFGDPEASFSSRASTLLPYSSGNFTLRSLPADFGPANPRPAYNDILLPTPDGIVAFTSPSGSKQLMSYPFANDPGNQRALCASTVGGVPLAGTPVLFFPIDKHRLGIVVRKNSDATAHLTVFDAISPTAATCVSTPACGLTVRDPLTVSSMEDPHVAFVDHYETAASPLSSVIALGLPDPGLMTQQTCAFRFDDDGIAGFQLTPLTPSPIAGIAGPITLARASVGATCPTLFVPKAGPVAYYPPAATTECTLDSASGTLPYPLALPTGHIPLQPAIAGQAEDALVLMTPSMFTATTEVVSLGGTPDALTTTSMFTSPRGLYPILFGDLDGDGTIEGIAPSYGGPVAQRDFEIMYRSGGAGLGFLPYRLTTQSAPTYSAVGDFDGNGLVDLAYAEQMGDRERVMVSYGTRDRPLEPVEMASFSSIVAFTPLDLADSIEPTGTLLDDLVVVERPGRDGQQGASGAPPLTVLHGNPQRSMLAYYDPRPVNSAQTDFITAVAGNFDGTSPAPDLIALERTTNDQITLWLAKGSLGPGLDPVATPVGTLPITANCLEDKLCAPAAKYVAWKTGSGSDVLIAIDNNVQAAQGAARHLVTIDPRTPSLTPSTVSFPVPPGLSVFGMFPADLDRDGSPQLVTSLVSFSSLFKDTVVVCEVDASGIVTACSDLTELIPELAPGWHCGASGTGAVSAQGRLDLPAMEPRPSDQLLVLCRHFPDSAGKPDAGVVYRITSDSQGRRAEPIFRAAADWEFISLGDANGDQLTDMVGISLDQTGLPELHIHLQCEARDVKCRADNQGVVNQETGP